MSDEKVRKYIFVVGGVMSGVGKGVTTSSIGTLMQAKGYRVSLIKADPYLNVDAGTMNPTEHGEVFVLDSGLETDQDMGNYERFLGLNLPPENYMTNGMVFKHVIDRERALEYEGKCVEPTYHITEEILRRIEVSVESMDADITVFEIGGTVGEYQNAIFLEAARQLKNKYPKDVLFVMVSFLPIPSKLGEMKTKPTQNAVRQLNSYGITPNIIIGRSRTEIDEKRKEKIANMTGIPVGYVISAPDVASIYDVPVNFAKEDLGTKVSTLLGLEARTNDLSAWERFLETTRTTTSKTRIAVVGKYFNSGDFVLSDVYISVLEAIKFSAYSIGAKADIDYIDSEEFETNPEALKKLADYDGVLIPGGFGSRGIEGKLRVIQYVRENKIPYFGLCYGMQLLVIEYARNVVGLAGAHTREINPTSPHLVINIMDEQRQLVAEGSFGGTMRLGAYPAELLAGSVAARAYGTETVVERHRHRYEVNPEHVELLEQAGLVFSGRSPDGALMEIAELPTSEHPFFLGTQFHPEFLARPLAPHPLFTAFMQAASERSRNSS